MLSLLTANPYLLRVSSKDGPEMCLWFYHSAVISTIAELIPGKGQTLKGGVNRILSTGVQVNLNRFSADSGFLRNLSELCCTNKSGAVTVSGSDNPPL